VTGTEGSIVIAESTDDVTIVKVSIVGTSSTGEVMAKELVTSADLVKERVTGSVDDPVS